MAKASDVLGIQIHIKANNTVTSGSLTNHNPIVVLNDNSVITLSASSLNFENNVDITNDFDKISLDIIGGNGTLINNLLQSIAGAGALDAAQGKILNDSKINIADIINTLLSTAIDKPLSAAQGKILKDLIDGVVANGVTIVNNLTETVTGKALDATQGLALATLVNAKLNSSSYTASDVLAKLLTVDGIGSGLDANLLNGLSSTAFELVTNKGIANGYVPLNSSTKIANTYLPDSLVGALAYQGSWNASTNTPTIPTASSTNKGSYYITSVDGSTSIDGITNWVTGDWLVSNGVTWDKVDNTDAVFSVNGRLGAITLTKGDVNLGNVDNTSDANKPVSTAQQTALNLKVDIANVINVLTNTSTTNPLSAAQGKALKDLIDALALSSGSPVWGAIAGTLSNQTDLNTVLNAKANLANPTFTTAINSSGFLQIAQQSTPATPTSSTRFFVDSSNRLSWIGTNGFTRTFDATAITANRIYTLPDVAGTIALTSNVITSVVGSLNRSAPTNQTIFLFVAPSNYTITRLLGLKLDTGSLTLTIQINGVSVTGLTSLSVTSTVQSPTATANNVATVGQEITVIINSVSSPTNLRFSLAVTA